MSSCDYCGEVRTGDDLDWAWNHWIKTGHHTTDLVPDGDEPVITSSEREV